VLNFPTGKGCINKSGTRFWRVKSAALKPRAKRECINEEGSHLRRVKNAEVIQQAKRKCMLHCISKERGQAERVRNKIEGATTL
jgi:hypothetical protein